MIEKRDLHKVEALLLSIGYEPGENLNETQERICALSDYERVFTHSSRATEVEIQWAVWRKGLSLTPLQMGLWERAALTTLFGTNMLITPPEFMLLLACVHGTKHVRQNLQWI